MLFVVPYFGEQRRQLLMLVPRPGALVSCAGFGQFTPIDSTPIKNARHSVETAKLFTSDWRTEGHTKKWITSERRMRARGPQRRGIVPRTRMLDCGRTHNQGHGFAGSVDCQVP